MKKTLIGDSRWAKVAQQITADTNLEPAVVLTGQAEDGSTIRVYEAVALGPTDSDPVRRGYLFIAVNTEVRTYPSRRDGNGAVISGRIIGPYLTISTRSAQDALARARVKLADAC